jgi:hypothetical protein
MRQVVILRYKNQFLRQNGTRQFVKMRQFGRRQSSAAPNVYVLNGTACFENVKADVRIQKFTFT